MEFKKEIEKRYEESELNKIYSFPRIASPRKIKKETKFAIPARSSLKYKNPFEKSEHSFTPPPLHQKSHTYNPSPKEQTTSSIKKRAPVIPKIDTASIL